MAIEMATGKTAAQVTADYNKKKAEEDKQNNDRCKDS